MMYNIEKNTRRNSRTTLPAPSSSSEEELGQNREAGATPVPPSTTDQPGPSTIRITNNPQGQVSIISNHTPTGVPAGTHLGQKKKRKEGRGRKAWTKDDNTTLMKLYFRSDPSRRGFRKRLFSLWQDEEMFPATEQRLADQARSIQQNTLLSDVGLMELMAAFKPDPPSSSP